MTAYEEMLQRCRAVGRIHKARKICQAMSVAGLSPIEVQKAVSPAEWAEILGLLNDLATVAATEASPTQTALRGSLFRPARTNLGTVLYRSA